MESDKVDKAMKNNAIKWLYTIPGKKKLYIIALALIQALNGASGVLYAKILIPVAWLYRPIRGIFKRRNILLSEFKYLTDKNG